MDGNGNVKLQLTEQGNKTAENDGQITPDKIRSASIRIGGREIPLAYDLRTQIAIDQEIGMNWDTLRNNVNNLKNNTNTKIIIQAIRILGNRGLAKAGEKPDLTDDWLIDHIVMKNMLGYKIAIIGTLTAGWYMETDDTNEQEEIDVGLMEIRKKNGSTN